ncbi:helix-turn-helix transcriptional regulator [Parabacteroides sp. PF5-9]|uniref:AraC family transcriptional regulator n=1 Tax=Parabacteroides sp. PF5-9 TaxID=1742404 RepID=UPI0024756D90|nr:helix-turn-helix transcriptional regulator [Parabacteroides sp. PF5-9]
MEKNSIRVFDFKVLPIEVEVKELAFVKELPKLFRHPHRAAFYQIIWLSEGSAIFRIDFQKITIQANEILIISSGQVCEFDTISDYSGKIILFTSSFFSISELDTSFLHIAEILNPINLNKTVPISPTLAGSLIALLEEELERPTDYFQAEIAHSYLRAILLGAERCLTTAYPPVTDHIGRMFYNAVEKYFKENRNTEFYVNLLGINEKTLCKEVKKLTGKTPKVYIDSRTILEAKRLLAYSTLSVKEIGFELGFDEPTNFNKYFRKHTQITPIQFRNSTKR